MIPVLYSPDLVWTFMLFPVLRHLIVPRCVFLPITPCLCIPYIPLGVPHVPRLVLSFCGSYVCACLLSVLFAFLACVWIYQFCLNLLLLCLLHLDRTPVPLPPLQII